MLKMAEAPDAMCKLATYAVVQGAVQSEKVRDLDSKVAFFSVAFEGRKFVRVPRGWVLIDLMFAE